MPRFHIVSAGALDAPRLAREIAAGERPRHFALELARALGASLYEPEAARPGAAGFLERRLLGLTPAQAGMVERVLAACGDDDVVFCNGEGPGFALARALRKSGRRTRLALTAHNPLRPRMALATALGVPARADLFYVLSPALAAPLERRRALAGKIRLWTEQIDDAFFTPGPPREKPDKPVIVSIGLEQRDLRALALAAKDLDVLVRVSNFSRDARAARRGGLDDPPANFSARYYSWPDLVDAYRGADLVVAPLVANRYAAGITSILEAASVGRAIVASATEGLRGTFAGEDAVVWVPPGDVAALRAAIVSLLGDEPRRRDLAARAHAAFLAHHRKDARVGAVAEELRALAADARPGDL